MVSAARRRLLADLGLTDWQPRVDGPLGPAVSAPRPAPEAAYQAAAVEANAAAASGAAEAAPAGLGADTAERVHGTAAAAPAPDDPSQLDWTELEAWLARQDHRGANRAVFGVGARDADLLIVGEAPGASEDEQGLPFVGRAGKLLDRMLFAIGCARETNVYITNICKFRPPNNRDPNAEEIAADWPVLERQIELMNPRLVVAVGRVAAQTLLGSTDSLGRMRGRLHAYPRRELNVLVTYHPAYLLRSPGQKAKAWDDLRDIARAIAD